MRNVKIAALMTVFNRKDYTIRCLKQTKRDFFVDDLSCHIDIFLTDDGSSDGTFESVQSNFPDVHVYKTDGSLFWGRGMLHSWEKAMENGTYDAFLWMNDDIELLDCAFNEVVSCAAKKEWKAIVCGSLCDTQGVFTYGGLDEKKQALVPDGTMREICWMNGNFVLVPSCVVDKIGLIDGHFHHVGGDYDYGYMARQSDIHVFSTRCYIGKCARNPKGDSRGRIIGHSVVQRWRDLYKSPFIDNPLQKWYELRKHGRGMLFCVMFMLKMHILVWLPDRVYLKIIRKHSK